MASVRSEPAAAWASGGEPKISPTDRPPRELPCGSVQSDACLSTYYARRAPEMEEAYTVPQRQTDLARLRELLCDLARGQDVVEIACGTGYWTQVMAASARSVLAVDISEEMLALARAKTYPGNRVTFVRDDAWTLGAVRGCFTAGLALFWWSHLPKSRIRPFLARLHQVLQPGARVTFADNLRGDCRWTAPVRVDAEGNTYQRRLLRTGEVFEIIKNYPDEAELRTAIDGLGEEVRYLALRCVWVLSYRPLAQIHVAADREGLDGADPQDP